MPFTTLAEKGRIVIPAKLRKKYGMKIGDKYQVKDDNGHIVIIPKPVTHKTVNWSRSWTRKMEAALKDVDSARFDVEARDGASVKRSLERSVDDLNLYYGSLVANCLNLPQPPLLEKSEFATLREGTMALQVAQRRFTNLLHDVLPQDLDKTATDEHQAAYSLRQLLEMTAAHYHLRVKQLDALGDRASARG